MPRAPRPTADGQEAAYHRCTGGDYTTDPLLRITGCHRCGGLFRPPYGQPYVECWVCQTRRKETAAKAATEATRQQAAAGRVTKRRASTKRTPVRYIPPSRGTAPADRNTFSCEGCSTRFRAPRGTWLLLCGICRANAVVRDEWVRRYTEPSARLARRRAGEKAARNRRRAEKAATQGVRSLGRAVYQAIAAEAVCVYCGDPADSADHVVPLARGGRERPNNLVPACRPCNSAKGKRLLHEWDVEKALHACRRTWKVREVVTRYGERDWKGSAYRTWRITPTELADIVAALPVPDDAPDAEEGAA